jgi:hypothetical protein
MADRFPVRITPARFINAEPAASDPNSKKDDFIVLSFGDEEGPVTNLGISLDDGRDMVCSILQCLAHCGDELALKIGREHFWDEDDEGKEMT